MIDRIGGDERKGVQANKMCVFANGRCIFALMTGSALQEVV